MARTTLANSITLTPGTMTVDVVGSDFYIHCLAVEDEKKLLDIEREFEQQVERLFVVQSRESRVESQESGVWGGGLQTPDSRLGEEGHSKK